MMDKLQIIMQAEQYAKSKLAADTSGHDWPHVERMVNTARTIAEHENADVFVCTLAALLHDVADDKLVKDIPAAQRELEGWLQANVPDAGVVPHVLEIIGSLSFKGGGRPPMRTVEGRIVQDADRLDALGAVGIARVFVYSGWKGRPMHDPDFAPREGMTAEEYRAGGGTAVSHFYEKLLKLKDLMNTGYAARLAEERHKYMEEFLARFYEEWEGRR